MKFRTRLVITLAATTALTTSLALSAATYVVERSEERQLDEALRAEAREEALEVATAAHTSLRISDRGGPEADDVGRLTKFAAIYARDGHVEDKTATFASGAPNLATMAHVVGTPFDLTYAGERLRVVVVAIPNASERLLLGAPLADLEKDTTFLRRVMLITGFLAIAFTVLVMWRVVTRLTRGHDAIARTARNVAAGKLDARVGLVDGDDEVVQLARDVDDMIKRLATLVESQQRFVAHAAHELRSPLTTLYGELQLAVRRSRTPEEYRASIEEALDSARRLKTLANDLLALARIGAATESPAVPVSVEGLANHAASWCHDEAARRRVVIELKCANVQVPGHALDLERLLRNLLDNAIRHSPEGATVRVIAENTPDGVDITVSDEGSGIAPELSERVFEPFFRAPSERPRDGGSGLGLAIVREIARAHGGDVVVVSSEKQGAAIRARFPAPHDHKRTA
jgi:two-component system heavy metal sensor histidine kinase CusS